MPPNPGFPYSASFGGAGTMRTFDQSASSSSATISGSEVSEPCPISTAGDWMKMVPSVAMLTQGLKAGAFPAVAASVAPRGSIVPLPAHPDSSTPKSEEHTSELQSLAYLVCRLLLEKKKK